MLAKCIFGTKMHFASRVSQTVFFECRVGGWLSVVDCDDYLFWVHRFTANSTGAVVYGTV